MQIIHKRRRNQDQYDVVLNQEDVPIKFEENIVKIVNISQTDNFKREFLNLNDIMIKRLQTANQKFKGK